MRIGALLLQLEIVERSQTFGRFATSRVLVGADIRITDAWGDEYVVEPSDSAAQILDRLRERHPDLRPADENSVGAFDDRVGAWPAWNQLLYDLGARESELVVFAPALRFREIARRDDHADLVVTDGVRDGLFRFPLDRGRMEGVPVDLGMQFAGDGDRMTFSAAVP